MIEKEQDSKVTVAGAGATGVISAYYLAQAGHKVEVYAKMPDPRVESHDIDHTEYSSTFGSHKDQRYITGFENHSYLEKVFIIIDKQNQARRISPPKDNQEYAEFLYQGMAEAFQASTTEGGGLSIPRECFNEASKRWLEKRRAVEPTFASERLEGEDLIKKIKELNKQIVELNNTYIEQNKVAMTHWYKLLTKIINDTPSIIETLPIDCDGVLRLYDSNESKAVSIQAHDKHGFLKRDITSQQLVSEYPAYQSGIDSDFTTAGAIEIYGITIGIKTLIKHLINKLEGDGVKFHFNSEITSIDLRTGNAQVVHTDHEKKTSTTSETLTNRSYVLNTGAFANPSLYSNMPDIKDKVAAVEGYWITVNIPKGAKKNLIQAMGGKSNKIHGSKSINELLRGLTIGRQTYYKNKFLKYDLKQDAFNKKMIVDFNNMVIDENTLGVGSGYIFKGVPDTKNGQLDFPKSKNADNLTLCLMQLWLERGYGEYLGPTDKNGDFENLTLHQHGCKRSWTYNDKPIYKAQLIDGGKKGFCIVSMGGNTGDTTAAPYNALLHVKFAELLKEELKIHPSGITQDRADDLVQQAHNNLVTVNNIEATTGWKEHWQNLTESLSGAIKGAQKAPPASLKVAFAGSEKVQKKAFHPQTQ